MRGVQKLESELGCKGVQILKMRYRIALGFETAKNGSNPDPIWVKKTAMLTPFSSRRLRSVRTTPRQSWRTYAGTALIRAFVPTRCENVFLGGKMKCSLVIPVCRLLERICARF